MSKSEQDEARAFHRGVEAMREHIAVNFDRYGPNQKWSGPQFANIVRRVEAPKMTQPVPEGVAS